MLKTCKELVKKVLIIGVNRVVFTFNLLNQKSKLIFLHELFSGDRRIIFELKIHVVEEGGFGVTDDVLIKKAKRGDTHALALLLQQHYSFLLKYHIKLTMNRSVAEDLTQETMLKAIEKIKLYNGKSKFSSWLMSIGTNLYIDQMRKRKREKHYVERTMTDVRFVFESINADWPEVLEVLGKLTDEQRIPIILKYYYGYSLDEISEMMKSPLGTIKSRVHNGLKRMRKEIDYDKEDNGNDNKRL